MLATVATLLFVAATGGPLAEPRQQPDAAPLVAEADEALQRTAQGPDIDYPIPVMPWHLWRISVGRRIAGSQPFTENLFEFIDAALRVELEVAHTDSGEWRIRPLSVIPLPAAQLGELPIRDLRLGPSSAVRIVAQHGPGCSQPAETLSPSLIWTVYCRRQDGRVFGSLVDGQTGAYQSPPPSLPAPLSIPPPVPPRPRVSPPPGKVAASLPP